LRGGPTESARRAFEDELHRRFVAGAALTKLADETELPLALVRDMIARAGDRRLGPARERERRAHRQTVIVEDFEQRDERLAALPGGRTATPSWLAAEALRRVDRAQADVAHVGLLRECPVCRRRFKAGRADRVTCSDHCRRLVARLRHGDARAESAVRMMLAAHECAGCGRPLWAMRPDAVNHGATCAKRARRAQTERTT